MAHFFAASQNTALVTTTKGKIRGYCYDGLSIFKGIPYATARRFHAPEPLTPWDGVMDCTSYGYVCPLLQMDAPKGELLVPHRYWPSSENCQNLNVWTPGCDDQKRPVLFWMHGGGYTAGSSIEQLAYEGENMAHYGDVVVVSVNHRLNILGYLDLSEYGEEYANSANAGSNDLIAALRWVQENIASFGGDPDNVTVMGQSGGGAKVTTLLQTPAADGLFHKGVNMSGVVGPILADSVGSAKPLVEAMLQELKLADVHALETVPYDRMAEAYNLVSPGLKQQGQYVGCTPKANAFYRGTPDTNGFRTETAGIPLMVGTVFGEFMGFGAPAVDKAAAGEAEQIAVLQQFMGKETCDRMLPMFREAYPERAPIDLVSLDTIFRGPAQQYIRQRAALNSCTYSYLFNQDFTMDNGHVAWHCADIPYFFHNCELVPVTQEEGVVENLENAIFSSLMAFMRTGNPGCEALPDWPACTPEEEHTMLYAARCTVRTNHDAELIPAMSSVLIPLMMKFMAQDKDAIRH